MELALFNKKTRKIWFLMLLVLSILGNKALGCAIPAQGSYWTHDELIDRTDTILLATPASQDHGHKFRVLETLKGSELDEFQWLKFRSKGPHRSEDFDGHANPDYWDNTENIVIRSAYFPGACTLSFTFVADENYLIFKESPGHLHSAEIIKSQNDKWYKYVLGRIGQNSKPQNTD